MPCLIRLVDVVLGPADAYQDPMAGSAEQLPFFGRVLKSFCSTLEGELSLTVGDLALVTGIQDRHWFTGQVNGQHGRFPRNNVSAPVDRPPALEGQPYFVTVAPFTMQQFGDLSFRQGEILVGLDQVDSNWWFGRSADGREGVFPTSLTWKVDLPRPSAQDAVGNGGSQPFTRRKARVLQNLVAQLPNELNLRKGAEVLVTGQMDDGWYIGQCDGQSGIFPPGFVSLLEEDADDTRMTRRVSPTPQPIYGNAQPSLMLFQQANNQLNVSNRPYGVANYDFHAQHSDELDLREGETVYLLKHVNNEWIQGENVMGRVGIFPTAFVRILVDCQPQAEADLLLLDFDSPPREDPAANQNLFPAEANHLSRPQSNEATTTPNWSSGGKAVTTTSLENVIERNLIQLGSSSSNQACRKQRPPSWTQTLTQLQVQLLPETVPSREQRETSMEPVATKPSQRLLITAVESEPDNPHKSIEKSVNPLKLPPVPPRQRDTAPSHRGDIADSSSVVIRQQEETNLQEAIHALRNDNHKALDDRGTPPRRSLHRISRPAPPPPVSTPNASRPSAQQHPIAKPTRPAPIRSLSLDPKALSGVAGDRVEGRRNRGEKEKQRKMEEDQMREVEMRKKVREQREKVLTELLVTEREYCRDLRLTCQIFELHNPEALERKGIDAATLFGNLLEVIKLSESFIDELNRCTRDGATSEEQSIGNCFIRNEPEFRRIYSQYCTTHEEAQTLMEKYETMPNVHRVLDQAVQTLRQQIVCFNMGSIIIKPVQRIMKYPLILGELIKCTESDHPDKDRLLIAAGLMTAVATYINESKRKKEIVLKYRDSGLEEKLSQKVARFNMHSVTKHTRRVGMKFKASFGIATTTRDEAFDEVEHKFIELVRVVQTALRDITAVCEQLKSTSQTQYNISEAVATFYGEGSRVPLIDNFRTAQRMIYTQHWQSFDSYVIQHVRNPLTALCDACSGPERLVQKRKDKMLDCSIADERLAKNKDSTLKRTLEEEATLARNTYVALNSQLLEELPVITQHGYSIYRRCLSSFLYARKLLVGRVTKALLDLNEMPDIANLQGAIEEDFNAGYGKAVERLTRVTFINRSFRVSRVSVASSGDGSISPNDVTPPRKTSSILGAVEGGMVVQSRESINVLRNKYHTDSLYMVNARCDIKEPLDLAANSGLIVAVIKREDPMGNTGRWFVDAGEVRGFLPAKHLSLVPTSSSTGNRLLRPDSTVSVTSSGGASGTSTSLDSFKDALDEEFGAGGGATAAEPEPHTYDLPPSYDDVVGVEAEAASFRSPHRYSEIQDLQQVTTEEEEEEEEDGRNTPSSSRQGPYQAESPIYAEIDEVLSPSSNSKEEAGQKQPALASSASGNMVYKVEYDFRRRTPLEIDLNEGELVTVLAKHDEAGNAEWWLVENDAGLQGYAPSAYLSQLVTDGSSSPQLFC